jgi:hypothetical protein
VYNSLSTGKEISEKMWKGNKDKRESRNTENVAAHRSVI